jgi:hypothetical protein
MKPRKPKSIKQSTVNGPVKEGSTLYRLLEAVARRVATRLKRESTRR